MSSSGAPWLGVYEELGLDWASLPEVPAKTLSHYVRDHARQFPDRDAIVFGGRGTTYRELDGLADRMAQGLVELGLSKGDVLAVHMPNLPQYVVAFVAAARLGVVITSLSPLLRPPELAHQLDDAGAVAVLTLAPLFPAIEPIAGDRPTLRRVIVSGPTDLIPGAPDHTSPTVSLGAASVHDFAAILRPTEGPIPDAASLDDVLYLQYTGGTTGRPKGAQLSSRNLICNNLQVDVFYGYRTGREIVASAFPFFHIGGAALLLNGLRTASTNILVPDPRNMEAFIGEMKLRPPTVIAAVPALYQMLVAQPDFRQVDFSTLRVAVSGGAPFAEAGIAELEEVVGGGRFCEVYGMTETSPVQTMNPAARLKPGFVGIPVPGTHLRIVDAETGTHTLAANEPGEVIVSGPQVMRGYAGRPEETAHALRELDARTWMYTGDIGFMDEEGYLRICDRAKDMLIVGGYKVFSVEVENKVASRPEVAMCAVVGCPDPERPGNEIVCLYVQKAPSAPSDDVVAETLASFCRETMAPYKVPKRIEVLEAIPLTSVAKVDKIALRERARA